MQLNWQQFCPVASAPFASVPRSVNTEKDTCHVKFVSSCPYVTARCCVLYAVATMVSFPGHNQVTGRKRGQGASRNKPTRQERKPTPTCGEAPPAVPASGTRTPPLSFRGVALGTRHQSLNAMDNHASSPGAGNFPLNLLLKALGPVAVPSGREGLHQNEVSLLAEAHPGCSMAAVFSSRGCASPTGRHPGFDRPGGESRQDWQDRLNPGVRLPPGGRPSSCFPLRRLPV